MSLVRWGQDNSDVYVIANVDGTWHCVGCSLVGARVPANEPERFIQHLDFHRFLGDSVPQYVYDELKEPFGEH